MTPAMLRIAMTAMADRETSVRDLVRSLGIGTTTLYRYVGADGALREPGRNLLEGKKTA